MKYIIQGTKVIPDGVRAVGLPVRLPFGLPVRLPVGLPVGLVVGCGALTITKIIL